MIKDDVLDTTGYGISQEIGDGDDRILYVNVDKQTVTDYNDVELSFNDFIAAN